jgi:hypothetical protein
MPSVHNPLLAAALALAAAAAPTLGGASIPPSYAVLVVAENREVQAASRGAVETMSALDAFFRAEPNLYRSEVLPCLAKGPADAVAACVRAVAGPRAEEGKPPPVVILARAEPGSARIDRVSWLCVGSGRNPAAPTPAWVQLDLATLITGPEPARTAERRKAMNCIYAATAESRTD